MIVAWLTVVAALVAQAPPAPAAIVAPLTRETYVLELERLQAAIKTLDERSPEAAAQVITTLPGAWRVPASDGVIEVDARWLREAVARWQRQPTPALRQELVATLQAHLDEATSAETAPSLPDARFTLDRILSDREFARVRGPSAWDEFRQQLLGWIARLLARALGTSAVPTVARWLVGLLVIVAFGVAAFWMYRSLRRSHRLEQLQLDRSPAADQRPWRALLADAREAGDRGAWREAVHLAYWTAIAFLESKGTWRPDASRTPREYVRLLGVSDDARAPLESITRVFEQVWYAAATADRDRFHRALTALEELGCLSR